MVNINEKIDFVVVAYIMNKGRVLMIHHKKLNMWLPIGGHIELDEDPDEAMLREIKEECGLKVEILNSKPSIYSKGTKFLHTPSFMDIHRISDTHRHIVMVYFAKSESDAFVHNQEEHNDIRWFTKEDFDNPEFTWNESVRYYAIEALKVV